MAPLGTLSKDAFPCIKCPLHFSTKVEQASHLEWWEDFPNPWICHQCPTCCPTEDALRAHVNAIHGRSVLDKFGKGGHYCNAARDCGPPFGEMEQLIQHMKHDHVNQMLVTRKTTQRGCSAKGCEFTNDSYVGLSLHHLHYHSPKCGCGLMFWKATELIQHRETCVEGRQKAEEALRNPKKRKPAISDQGLKISKRPREVNLVPASMETIYVTPSYSKTQSTPSKSNSSLISRLALPAQPKPIPPTSSSSTPSPSNDNKGTINMSATELDFSTLSTASKIHPASTTVPSPVITDLETGATPLTQSGSSPPSTASKQYSTSSAAPSPQGTTPGTSYTPVGSSEPSPLSMAGNTYSTSHSVPASMPLPPTTPFVAPLPVSIFQYGFKPDDFNPSAVYVSSHCSRAKYMAFPDDLPDEHVFNAAPQHIAYGNLLTIAVRYSNAEIHRRVNEDRPQPVLSSSQTVESRIRAAFQWAVDEKWGGFNNVEAARNWFTTERAKNKVSAKKSISLSDYTKRAQQNAAPVPTTSMATPPTGMVARSSYPSSGAPHLPVVPSSSLAGQKRAREDDNDDATSAKKAMSLSDYTQRVGQHVAPPPNPPMPPQPGGLLAPYSYSSSAMPQKPTIHPTSVAGQKRSRDDSDDNVHFPQTLYGHPATPLPTAYMMPHSGAMMPPNSYSTSVMPAQATPVSGQKRAQVEENDAGVSTAPLTFDQSSRVDAPAHKKAKIG